MLKILILEDKQDTREVLVRLVKKVAEEAVVYHTGSLDEARQYLLTEEGIDAFFIDINLDSGKEDTSGIVFAREVRKLTVYEFTPIIMITSIMGLEMRAYRELHCYQYIVKPFHKEEIISLVRKLLNNKIKQAVKTIVVKKNGINYMLDCSDIAYIQAVSRGICIYMKEDSIKVLYTSIKQIMEKLPKEDFIQCHRMYVVNKAYIDYIDIVNRMIRIRGTEDILEIGVTYRNAVRGLINEKE